MISYCSSDCDRTRKYFVLKEFKLKIDENFLQIIENLNVVKLREREGRRVDLGRSLKGHLQGVQ